MNNPAVMVLPRPTSSAMSIWQGHESRSRWYVLTWWGQGVTVDVTSPTWEPFQARAAFRM